MFAKRPTRLSLFDPSFGSVARTEASQANLRPGKNTQKYGRTNARVLLDTRVLATRVFATRIPNRPDQVKNYNQGKNRSHDSYSDHSSMIAIIGDDRHPMVV